MTKTKKTKFIFVTGGVYSSLGKGITASSIGRILKELGFKVAMQKLDPYLNINPATISPLQHGEVYITADGLQADLDLGNYERFIDLDLNKYASLTSGRIYEEVLAKERKNEYNGKTIQVIPHITNHIIEKFHKLAKTTDADFIIVEIGGTVGDIESIPFFETISIFAYQYGKENVMFAHCVPLIALDAVYGEIKTKPAQHSLRTLRSLGIAPDLVLLRFETDVDKEVVKKLSWLSNIDESKFFVAPNLKSTYFLPNKLFEQGIHKEIFKYFNISKRTANLKQWDSFVEMIKKQKSEKITVGIIGEYVELHDAYFSIVEASKISSYALDFEIDFKWISPHDINESNLKELTSGIDCFIFGGGENPEYQHEYDLFLKYAIKNNLLVLAYSRGFKNFAKAFGLDLKKDFKKLDSPVLGAKQTKITDENIKKAYDDNVLNERHQNYYKLPQHALKDEQNDVLEVAGLDDENHVDILKVKGNDFIYAVNFDPEFTARPLKPNPLMNYFYKKALINK